jgi:hypothetical protein
MSNENSNSILGEVDVAILLNQGLLGPGRSNGSRRIHKRRLNRSSDEEYEEIPLDVSLNSPSAVDAFATIPITLVSWDTLEYLGLSTGKADEIWSEWTQWPVTGPRRETDPDDGGLQVAFIDLITARLENYEDVYEDNDAQWYQCLNVCGISTPVQAAIMDPNFKHIRLTESCIFWVKDTLGMRYAGLEDIRRASRQRELDLMRAAARPGGRSSSGSGGSGNGRGGGRDGAAGQAGSTRGGSSSQGRRSISGLQQQTTPGISSILWNSNTAMEVCNKPDYIVLFKGIDQGRIAGLFGDSGEIQNIEKLLSPPPSDFSGTRSLFYFTPDYKVAEYYAAYAKRRANCESVVMICVSIPQTAISNLKESDLHYLYWPTPQWKQLVWRSKTAKYLPAPLRKYRDSLLIIGNISKGAERMYEILQSWEDMTNASLLRVGSSNRGDLAVQYVFSGEEEGRDFITEHGKIEVFPFSEAEVHALLARYLQAE